MKETRGMGPSLKDSEGISLPFHTRVAIVEPESRGAGIK